jgi:hypothetical protein
MDTSEFNRNRMVHTAEELAPYEEKYVAWSADGKQILAWAETEEELYREIDRQGITRYIVDFIPNSDISDLGGAFL